MTIIANKPAVSMVQSMRQIRDEISQEIKDMTYAEERDFLDRLLQNKKAKPQKTVRKKL